MKIFISTLIIIIILVVGLSMYPTITTIIIPVHSQQGDSVYIYTPAADPKTTTNHLFLSLSAYQFKA